MGVRALVPIRLKLEDYLTHGVFFGQTGKGKTYALALQLAALSRLPNVSVVWFSVKRQDPDFLRALGMENVLVLECGATGNNFRLDPFCLVEGVDLARQVEALTAALRVLVMEVPTFAFVRPIVADLLLAKRSGRPVSMLDLCDRVKAAKPSPMQAALLNRLALILERSDGSTFHAPGPFPFATLMRTNVMLRIGSLGYYSQLFLVNLLVAKALAWRGAREDRRSADDDGHLVLFVVDEAFLFAGPDHIDHEAPLRQLFQLGREWKLCGLLATARPSDLDPVFLEMCGLRMCSNVAGGGNLLAIKHAMGLDDAQAGTLGDLPKQCFIFQRRNVPAFPVHIPSYRVERSGWFDVETWNERVLSAYPDGSAILYRGEEAGGAGSGLGEASSRDSGTQREDRDGGDSGQGGDVLRPKEAHVASQASEEADLERLARGALDPGSVESVSSVKVERDALAEADGLLAAAVTAQPYNATTEIFKSLRGRLSQEDANGSRRRLIARGELTSHIISAGGKGRVSSLVLTPAGLRKYRLKAPAPCGRGSYEHQWLCYRIAAAIGARGGHVSVEHAIVTQTGAGRLVDVWEASEGVAYQIALHNQKRKEADAARDLLESPEVKRLVMVANNRRYLGELEEELRTGEAAGRMEFQLAASVLARG